MDPLNPIFCDWAITCAHHAPPPITAIDFGRNNLDRSDMTEIPFWAGQAGVSGYFETEEAMLF
jgi:hypothetical protein